MINRILIGMWIALPSTKADGQIKDIGEALERDERRRINRSLVDVPYLKTQVVGHR